MRRVVKWLGVPALAAVFGYYVVGPHYAGNTRLSKLVQEGKAAAQAHLPVGAKADRSMAETKPDLEAPPTSETANDPVSSDVPAPKVSVDVKPVEASASDEATPKPRRRRRHHRVDPSEEAVPEATPSANRTGPDPASTP